MNNGLMALALLGLSCLTTSSFAAGEVGLIKAESRQSYYQGFSWETGNFQAQVANIGSSKRVFAHVKKTDGSWVDFPLFFSRNTGANKEIWQAYFVADATGNITLPGIGPIYEFALKYQVNGQTYWDNNGSANYKLSRGEGSLLGKGVNLSLNNYADEIGLAAGASSWNTNITLRNIAPAKNVKVVYSTDNWLTKKEVAAVYSPLTWTGSHYDTSVNPNVMGFEEWNISIPAKEGDVIQYAVSYSVNGVTYWDNNFGLNYKSRFYTQLVGKRSG